MKRKTWVRQPQPEDDAYALVARHLIRRSEESVRETQDRIDHARHILEKHI